MICSWMLCVCVPMTTVPDCESILALSRACGNEADTWLQTTGLAQSAGDVL